MIRAISQRLLPRFAAAAALLLSVFPAAAADAPVGLVSRAWTDPARKSWRDDGPRPLQTTVWYPAAAGARETAWNLKVFKAGTAAFDAPFDPGARKAPLVVVSHGTGGAAATVAWLAHALAAHGYIVAAVDHHGNTMAESKELLKGFMLWWERPKDVRAAIDHLLADPEFGPRIDAARIGVAGFSIGAYTALADAGVRLDVPKWRVYCAGKAGDPMCHLPPEADFDMHDVEQAMAHDEDVRQSMARGGEALRDARVRAAFAIAPVLGPLYTPESLAQVDIPVHIVVGAQDDQSIPALNAMPAAAAIPRAELQVLPGVTHYTFLPECRLLGAVFARQFCVDPDGIARNAVQAGVAADALRFFDKTLGTPH